jgi:hypothetical protein
MAPALNQPELNSFTGSGTVTSMTMLIGFFLVISTFTDLKKTEQTWGNLNDTLYFIDVIGELGLIELPLKGRAYTWSNMQFDPLLEQLDWFFTSPNWTLDHPHTEVLPLAKITSDHIPCKIAIDTRIPTFWYLLSLQKYYDG